MTSDEFAQRITEMTQLLYRVSYSQLQRAVSYTHLDVYKRQLVHRVKQLAHGVGVVDLRDALERRFVLAVGALWVVRISLINWPIEIRACKGATCNFLGLSAYKNRLNREYFL